MSANDDPDAEGLPTELSLARASALIDAGELSSAVLVEACLERIRDRDATLNSFITVCAQEARAAALEADRRAADGRRLGPLDGIPIALKDIIATRGVRTTAGSAILAEHVPDVDARCVTELKAAGAVILGKNNAHEFAYGVTNDNPHWGRVLNPHAHDRIPGGSSGGSAAAVAAGLAPAAIGSDTGGSIRIPAGCCGIVGLKPTYDLVSREGVVPQAWSLDHLGPLTRSVADARLVLEGLIGRSLPASQPRSLEGVRVGVPRALAEAAEPRVRAVFERALEALRALGAEVVDHALSDVERARRAWLAIVLAESAAYHRRHLREAVERIGDDVRPFLLAGALIRADTYLDAQRVRRYWAERTAAELGVIDLVATPTLPAVAPRRDETAVETGHGPMPVRDAMVFYQWPANLLGWPSLSVPCRERVDGMPVGLLLTGRPYGEAALLDAGAAFEAHEAGHG
jgi:aspartyl-tRNA(Asn)/glutamyl-tRNA(Gln) amidotransferase subunit A